MATKFTTSVNIIRDKGKELNYIPTPNSIRVVNQITNDFKKGIRSFNIIGSYGTGKSAFLWAFQESLTNNKKYFGINLLTNPTIGFINIVGEYKSIKDSFADLFGIKNSKNLTENIFSEIFNKYHDLGKKNPILFLLIDEFGKFLEYAAQNDPEKELYFIQQLAEFVNNPDINIVLFTTVHQNFDAYALSLSQSQKQEWTKVKGRFREITFNEPVEQLLFLASEHLNKLPSTSKHVKEIQNAKDLLIKSKAFNANIDYINDIVENLYPLDAISAYILTLSLQKYGQNERSLFSFLESTDHTGLFQHKQTKEGFYTISDVHDYLVFNYYSYINSRYNPDFSAWKSIKTALEKSEAIFENHTLEYSKIIKTIGLLTINAQAGATLDKKFLVSYAEKCLAIKNAENFIEELEKRKIILYRNYSKRYVLFDGTDLDIQIAIDNASVDENTSVVTLLNKYYQLPPIIAKKIMYKTGTPRLFEYKISAYPINEMPDGEIDGFINLVFNEKNILNEVKLHSAENKEAVLYCYYKNSKSIKELLFDIERTKKVITENEDDKVAVRELNNIITHQQNLLTHKILNNFSNPKSEVEWFYKGESINIRDKKEFNSRLSAICEDVYFNTPRFNNELVNKHKISSSIHSAKRNFFKALINNWDKPQLGFDPDKFPPEKTIYLSLLENNGIKLCRDELLSDVEPHNENGIRSLWDVSVNFLNSAKSSKRNISELVETLNARPFKLKKGFIDFWVPTFLFIKRNEFALFNVGIYTPYINLEILELIAKIPQDFELKSFALEGVKLDIFNSYRGFLNIDTKKNINTQDFIETIKPFLVFYRALPEYSKETKRLSKQSIAIRAAIANSKDPEQSFFQDFPTALGYSVVKIQKDRSELQHFIIELQDAIKEIRNCFDELVNRFEAFILDTYFDTVISFEEYQRAFQERYKGLHRHLLLNTQKSFVQRIDSKIEDKKAWLNSLAQSLTGKSLEKFNDDDELVLYDKFTDMILSLDSLNEISKVRFDEEKEIALNVQINSYSEEGIKKVIRLPKGKNKAVEKLEVKIKQLLSKDKNIDLAALTSVLKDLL